MAVLCNGLKQLGYLVAGEVFHKALMIEVNTHWLVIRLTKSLGSQENPVCRANWANMRMFIACGKCDFLPVFTVLLNSESDF